LLILKKSFIEGQRYIFNTREQTFRGKKIFTVDKLPCSLPLTARRVAAAQFAGGGKLTVILTVNPVK
jgi:hypothetical protein